MGYVIGVDVGTQSVKAVLVSGEGSEAISASAPCETSHPLGGWAEQDPDGLVRALAQSVRQVRREAGLASAEVTMLAVACQLDGLVALGGT
jgi:xylulokinase